MFEKSEGQGENLQNLLAEYSMQCWNSRCWLLCYGEDSGLSTVSNMEPGDVQTYESGDVYFCSSSADSVVLTEYMMLLVLCWVRLLGSQWGWLRLFSKEDFGKWREVKNNVGVKLYPFHIVCTGVSYTWFIILYRHLGWGWDWCFFVRADRMQKSVLLIFFFFILIYASSECLYSEHLWHYDLLRLTFFQTACLKVVITLISQHNLLFTKLGKSVENSSCGEVV